MGSCYSTSTYLGTGKRSVTDTVTVTGEVGVLQSWKSGRWKRKKSGGDVTYGGVGGGGCNNEIEIISGSGSGSGKIFINGSSSSKLACLYTQQGKKGVNQDAMVVWEGQDLVIGNVGYSRAVLATRDKDNCLIAVQLTVDLKPDLPGEAARIQQCKGRVFALQDEPEVARVWLPNNDSPGLAMARAFGDFCLKDFGLISIPDVYHHHITERDEFIILATDGVWDVLSNKEAADVVASAPGRTTAARALVDCASRSWRLKYPTSKNDDCAAVCLFFNHQSVIDADVMETSRNTTNEEAKERMEMTNDNANCLEINDSHTSVPKHSDSTQGSDEIVPVPEPIKEKLLVKGQSRRSLAEFISTADDDEWSALEGITRVNSLLSIPRFLSGDKGSASRRKWL